MSRLFAVAVAMALIATINMLDATITASAETGQWASITDLGAPGGLAEGFAINDRGWVAGNHGGIDGSPHLAFRWTPEMGLRDLPTLGGDGDEAVGINNRGVVVGLSRADGGPHVVLWTDDNISVIPIDSADPGGINDRGTVVGSFLDHNFPQHRHGFTWSAAHGLTDLGQDTWAKAVNDRGVVVGVFYMSPGSVPIRWIDGVPHRLILPRFPFVSGTPEAVNSSGDAVGVWNCCEGIPADGAALWPREGGFRFLGTIIKCFERVVGWTPHGINDRGAVVGNYDCARSQRPRTAVAFIDGQLLDLNSLLPAGSGWHLETANAINRCGQVTGSGFLNDADHAYVLQLPWNLGGRPGCS